VEAHTATAIGVCDEIIALRRRAGWCATLAAFCIALSPCAVVAADEASGHEGSLCVGRGGSSEDIGSGRLRLRTIGPKEASGPHYRPLVDLLEASFARDRELALQVGYEWPPKPEDFTIASITHANKSGELLFVYSQYALGLLCGVTGNCPSLLVALDKGQAELYADLTTISLMCVGEDGASTVTIETYSTAGSDNIRQEYSW
jgi:hypothetical protein